MTEPPLHALYIFKYIQPRKAQAIMLCYYVRESEQMVPGKWTVFLTACTASSWEVKLGSIGDCTHLRIVYPYLQQKEAALSLYTAHHLCFWCYTEVAYRGAACGRHEKIEISNVLQRTAGSNLRLSPLQPYPDTSQYGNRLWLFWKILINTPLDTLDFVGQNLCLSHMFSHHSAH